MKWLEIRAVLETRSYMLRKQEMHDPLDEDYRRLGRVIRNVKKHVRRHYPELLPAKTKPVVPERQWMRNRNFNQFLRGLKSRFANYGTVMAFDAEWTRTYPITEVGIALRTGDQVEVYNFRVAGIDHPEDGFVHGETIVLPKAEMREAIRALYARADAIVGHSLPNDERQMHLWNCPMPAVPMHDTARISRSIDNSKRARSLKVMCERYGVDLQNWHSGGNDAKATLDLIYAIIGSDFLPEAPPAE